MRITLLQFILSISQYTNTLKTRRLWYEEGFEASRDAKKYGIELLEFEDNYAVFEGDKSDICRYVFEELDILSEPHEILQLLKVNGLDEY